MGVLTLLIVLCVNGMLPTMSVGDREVLQPGHPPDPKNVRQTAWYPGISVLRPAASSSNALTGTDLSVGNWEYEPEAATANESVELQIEVWCFGDLLTLGVVRTLNGVDLNPEAVALGDGCRSNGVSPDRLWFTYSFSQCGTRQTMHNGNEVYSNLLQHIPDPSDPAPQQVGVFAVPVHCAVDRLQEDYLSPIMMSVPVSLNHVGFELKTMSDSWTGVAETNVYHRGKPIHFQATYGRLAEGQQLFVPSCHATAAPHPESKPRVRVIVKKGCVAYVVSKRGQARFVPSGRSDAVRFVFGAFHFRSPESGFPQIYLHCKLAVHEPKVTPGSKFCNYNQRWEELSGDINVCSCCKTECDPAHKDAPPGLIAQVSIGPLIVMDGVNALLMETGPALVPQQSPLPIALETVPVETSPPPLKGDRTVSAVPLGYQGWVWTPIAVPAEQVFPTYADVGYLDGHPVLQEERWSPPYGTPQGWLSATAHSSGFTWTSPPGASDGVPRPVPLDVDAAVERGPQVQNKLPGEKMDSTDLLQYLQDDPSASESFNEPEHAANELFAHLPAPPSTEKSDLILEESKRKKWGSKLKTLIQEGSALTSRQDLPHRAQNLQQPEPANPLDLDLHDENLLGGVDLDDEGVVLQRTEVVMHKQRGHQDPVVRSWFHSHLALTRSEGPARLRYEEETGLREGDQATKRRIFLEEENIQPLSLLAVIGRMYKAE